MVRAAMLIGRRGRKQRRMSMTGTLESTGKESAQASVRVVVSKDRMLAELHPPIGTGEIAITRDQLITAVSRAKLAPLTLETLNQFFGEEKERMIAAPVELARGTPAADDVPARLELMPELAAPPAKEANHYDRHHYLTAAAGQKIARVIPAIIGKDGTDVFGKTIVRGGRSKTSTYQLGANVTVDQAGIVLAAISGAVRHEHGKLWIEPILEVPGDVDFSVGNIDFGGDVHIRGSVLDLFHVKTHGTIHIHGSVEAAEIHAGTNLIVDGAIVGKDKGHCSAGGDISLKHATNAIIRAGKDIHGQVEIASSHVDCGGLLEMNQGAIIGGVIRARGGLSCGTLGSGSGTKTVVEVGTDPKLRESIVTQMREIKLLQKRAGELHQQALPFEQNKGHLNAKQKESLTELLFEISEAEGKCNQIVRGLREAFEASRALAKQEIRVSKRIFAGVTIRFPDLECTLEETISGPTRLVPRHVDKGVMIFAVAEHGAYARPIQTKCIRDDVMHVAEHVLGIAK